MNNQNTNTKLNAHAMMAVMGRGSLREGIRLTNKMNKLVYLIVQCKECGIPASEVAACLNRANFDQNGSSLGWVYHLWDTVKQDNIPKPWQVAVAHTLRRILMPIR